MASFIPLLAQQEEGYHITNKRKVAEIPFQLVNNLIVVPVMLDDLIPLNFLVDTGVRTTILTERFYSDFLGIKYDRKISIKGAGNLMEVEAYIASNVNFSLHDLMVREQSMLVLEKDYLELSNQLGMKVEGILGYDLFRSFVVKIDYQTNIMTLYEPSGFKPSRNYVSFALNVEDTKPYISCQMINIPGEEKRPLKLMIDTGASHALLLHQSDSCDQFSLPEKTIYGNLGRGLAGDIVGHIGRIPYLHFSDKFKFKQVITSFPEEVSYGNIREGGQRDGTIGGELLSRFTVIFDYPNEAFYMSRNKRYSDPFIYNKTGLTLTAKGADLSTFKVVEVREKSPAATAGIQSGDIILKINGVKAKHYTLASLYEKLRKRDGKKIRLRMKRGEEEFRAIFRLKDII